MTLTAVDPQGAAVEIFTGFILESELEFEIYGSQTARLRSVSQSYSMDTTPRRKYYFQKTPQDVAQELVGAAGLKLAGAIDGQKLSFVQMEETDFRFLLRFVDESEKWLRPTDGGVEVQAAFQSGTTLSWRGEYGLVQFHAVGKLGARQLAGSHYDYRKMQSEVLSNIQDDPALYASSARMSAAVKAQSAKLGQGFVTARDRLLSVDDLSPRLQKESRRSTGKMVLCRGVSREQRLKAGDEVTVDGVLDANGTYGLVRVEHRWTVNGYENDFLCTPWKRFTTGEAIPVPRFDGVVPARVANNNDPEGIGRIQVQYYWQEDSFTCWIRAMTPHAGADRGMFCLPEVGDEVWVMFEEGDPERGRILGAAWNGKTPPPREELWGGDVGPNDVKRMVTKSGHRISLDDKPGKNAIVVATPEHVKLSMMESSNETGDAMLALHSDGDVFLSAPAGRIHFHSKFWSREVGSGGAAVSPGTTKQVAVSKFTQLSSAPGSSVKDCKALLNNLQREAAIVANDEGDPVKNGSEVNRRITAAYAGMYQRCPDLHWAGAATFVSKQMGCNMRYADFMSDSSWVKQNVGGIVGHDIRGLAISSKTVLVRGNQAIFKDIYPQYRLFELSPQCATVQGEALHLNPKMIEGFKEYEKGNRLKGMLAHADYEQNVVLQDQVMEEAVLSSDVARFQEAQHANEEKKTRWFGQTQPEQVSFSKECVASDSGHSPFYFKTLPGEFTKQEQRWSMAVPVLERYDELMRNHPTEMKEAIQAIGRDMETGNLPNYPKPWYLVP